MNIKLHQELFNKQLTRKQFLQVIGATILSVIGFTAFITNLNQFAQNKPSTPTDIGLDYGESAYGQ